MKQKCLTIGLILLLLGTSMIPAMAGNVALSTRPSGRIAITVDDDGDGDYTSIRDALNHSHPGDIIEVYSGTYFEGEQVLMNIPEITLNGVPNELGSGNGTGKPFIQCSWQIFWIVADRTTVSGFSMQKDVGQGDLIDVDSVNGCRILNNTLHNGTEYPNTGIGCFNVTGIHIIDNVFTNIDGNGIFFEECHNASICGNSISNSKCGIFIDSSESVNITNNMIDACDVGIRLSSSDTNTLYLNNLESNSVGLSIILSGQNSIKHNNFINNSQRDALVIAGKDIIIQPWESVQNSWIENYWSDWAKIGPKIIPGAIFLLIMLIPVFQLIIPIGIPLPLFQFDRHPAQEPYEIS